MAVDKEPVVEDEEMRIARVTLRHGEAMHRVPGRALIHAAQDDRPGRGIQIMPRRADAEGEMQVLLEPDQIREGIVKDPAQIAHRDLRRIGGCVVGEDRGNERSRFHGSRSRC